MSEVTFNGVELSAHTIEVMDLPAYPARPITFRRRHGFYKQHKLAIWLIVDLLLLAAFVAVWSHNADLAWRLSTPLIRWIP